jgi:hypothetical protein
LNLVHPDAWHIHGNVETADPAVFEHIVPSAGPEGGKDGVKLDKALFSTLPQIEFETNPSCLAR